MARAVRLMNQTLLQNQQTLVNFAIRVILRTFCRVYQKILPAMVRGLGSVGVQEQEALIVAVLILP